MIKEHLVIEEVLLAEVAPGVRQDLSLSLVARIPVVDVISQLLQMVQSLLANEHKPPLETDLAECLLVLLLEVAFECLNAGVLVLWSAAVNEALELPIHAPLLLN